MRQVCQKYLAKDKDVLINLGSWNADAFPVWERLFIDRFQDMSEKSMTVICYPYERPLFYLLDGDLRGINYHILTALSDWLHYELNFIIDGKVRFWKFLAMKIVNSDGMHVTFAFFSFVCTECKPVY